MANNKKPTRKMPADVKRTLGDRRTKKQEAKRRAKAPAPPAAPQPLEVELDAIHVRLPDFINAEKLAERLNSPEGLAEFVAFLGNEGIPFSLQAEAARDPAEVADNAAVDLFADAMRERLAQKRAQGYGGWNDATQCDARKIARLFMDKLFGTADGEDLGNYLAFLHHFGHGGQYALREVIKERIGAIRTDANARADQLQKELTATGAALEYARAAAARAEANLARAQGYIDRVTEAEPPTSDVAYSEERDRIGHIESVRIRGPRPRGPQLDLGEPYRTSAADLMGVRR